MDLQLILRFALLGLGIGGVYAVSAVGIVAIHRGSKTETLRLESIHLLRSAGVMWMSGEAVIASGAIEPGLVSAPGIAYNRHCASGLAALQNAAASIMAGMDRVVVTGGVQSSSTAPKASRRTPGSGDWEEVVRAWASVGAAPVEAGLAPPAIPPARPRNPPAHGKSWRTHSAASPTTSSAKCSNTPPPSSTTWNPLSGTSPARALASRPKERSGRLGGTQGDRSMPARSERDAGARQGRTVAPQPRRERP